MLAAGRGAIVNISSQVARVGRPGLSPAYNASKAGLIGLTVAFSAQVADRGVRVRSDGRRAGQRRRVLRQDGRDMAPRPGHV